MRIETIRGALIYIPSTDGNFFSFFLFCMAVSSECRACYLDSQLYISTADDGSAEASGDIPDYINCPCCVFDTYGESTAADEGGSICESSGYIRSIYF